MLYGLDHWYDDILNVSINSVERYCISSYRFVLVIWLCRDVEFVLWRNKLTKYSIICTNVFFPSLKKETKFARSENSLKKFKLQFSCLICEFSGKRKKITEFIINFISVCIDTFYFMWRMLQFCCLILISNLLLFVLVLLLLLFISSTSNLTLSINFNIKIIKTFWTISAFSLKESHHDWILEFFFLWMIRFISKSLFICTIIHCSSRCLVYSFAKQLCYGTPSYIEWHYMYLYIISTTFSHGYLILRYIFYCIT